MIKETKFHQIQEPLMKRLKSYLMRNQNRAYKLSELSEHFKIRLEQIASYMSLLKKRNLVEHKRPYWKWKS